MVSKERHPDRDFGNSRKLLYQQYFGMVRELCWHWLCQFH